MRPIVSTITASVLRCSPSPISTERVFLKVLTDVLLGLIEGLTEFLPISSTGHLLIAQHWLGAKPELFTIAIQAGAILAITLVYRQRLWALLTGLREPSNRDYLLKLGAAFLVTAAVGLPVRKLGWELPETVTPVAAALILGGLWMLWAERTAERRPQAGAVTWKLAVLIGLAQVVAGVFPGTSRSAAAIFTAMLFGLNRRPAAAEFVFLLGIPTMFAASGYALLETVLDQGLVGVDWASLAAGFAAATVTGFAAVRWLLGYIAQHRFAPFAWYRIGLGAALLLGLPAGS